MLYIVFVIHGISNYSFLPLYSKVFSSMLFEMPVIFFISGASLKVSRSKPFVDFSKSRIKRIIIPYIVWVGGVICVSFLVGNQDLQVINLLRCRNVTCIPFINHIWFIYPYLIISVLGFYFIKIYNRFGNSFLYIYMIVAIIFILILDIFGIGKESLNLVRIIVVFSSFFVYGFTYKSKCTNKSHIFLFVFFFSIYFILILSQLYTYRTQENKFPPNLAYMCFGFIFVTLISLATKNKMILNNRIIQFSNKYGMEMYLYQNFAFWIYSAFISTYILHFSVIIQYCILCIVVCTILFPLSYFTNKINSYISKQIFL